MGADAIRWAMDAPQHEVDLLLAAHIARNREDTDRRQQAKLDADFARIKALAASGKRDH